jgi:hypothetical protein
MSEVNPLEIGDKSRSFLASGDIKIPRETYRIFGFWLTYVCTIFFVVFAIGFLTLGIIDIVNGKFNIHNFLLPIVFIIIACIISYFFPFYSSITVDLSNKEVVCRKYKLFFFVKKIVRIETQNIEKVYTEKNLLEGYGNDDKNSVNTFNLIFQMNNGEKIMGLEAEVDNNYEMTKVSYFMSKFFPTKTEEKGDKPDLVPESEEK